MKKLLAITAWAVMARSAALAATMASQPWVTNRIAEAEARVGARISAATNAIPAPDYSTGNAQLVATIEATAPAPGNYAAVSNRAMTAIQSHQSLWPAVSASTNYTDRALGAFASTGAVARAATYGTPTRWTDATGCVWEVGFALGNPVSDTPGAVWENYEWWPDYDLGKAYMRLDGVAWEQYANLYDGWTNFTFTSEATRSDSAEGSLPNDITFFRRLEIPVTNLVGRVALTNDIPDVSGYATQQQATNAATAVADAKISTNNAAFVSAVLAVQLTGADAGDLAEIAEYGGYGTVGAAILALIAGLAALKRGKADKAKLPYDIVQATPSNGVVTVGPRTIATYTAGTSAAAFTVAVGVGETGKGRDCELVIDCTATGAVAPTVTWPATFHPRTDAATDFACEAGVRNVYFISEFSSGEFTVGGWQETAGGNA